MAKLAGFDENLFAKIALWDASKSVGQMMFYFFNIRESGFKGLSQNYSFNL